MTFTAQFVELMADTLDQTLPYPLPRHTIIRCHIDQSCMYVVAALLQPRFLSCRFSSKTIEASTLLTIRVLTSLVPKPPSFCSSASVYYTERKLNNKNGGGLGMRIGSHWPCTQALGGRTKSLGTRLASTRHFSSHTCVKKLLPFGRIFIVRLLYINLLSRSCAVNMVAQTARRSNFLTLLLNLTTTSSTSASRR